MPVYFIRAGEDGPVKIGWSLTPQERCKNLQNAHYEKLQIIRLIDGTCEGERWLHDHFREWRIAREWFNFCQDMLTINIPTEIPRRFFRPAEKFDWLCACGRKIALLRSQLVTRKYCSVRCPRRAADSLARKRAFNEAQAAKLRSNGHG